MSQLSFNELPVLIDRLLHCVTHKDRRVVFLLGAPLSAAETPGLPGVPGVREMVALIQQEVCQTSDAAENWKRSVSNSDAQYQKAFELLQAYRGQDVVNALIQTAVLRARLGTERDLENAGRFSQGGGELQGLEDDIQGWSLPVGLRSLGRIVADYPNSFGQTILTSNFDPLIEVSIKRGGGKCFRTVLHLDGNLAQTSAEGCHVVHFHGFWAGHDTLHTPAQLIQSRPRLRQSLARLLGSSTVVVLGYGGWDDIFTQALVDVVLDDSAKPDVLWSFYEGDASHLLAENDRLLQRLNGGIARGRVVLYRGIDCNVLLPRLATELSDRKLHTPVLVSEGPSGNVVSITHSEPDSPRGLEIRIQIKNAPIGRTDSDIPPHIDEWVGRVAELKLLESDTSAVIAITGIGGQGKTALAAHFLQSEIARGSFDDWDWRDCKEESDRLNTQLLKIISRLNGGNIDIAALETNDIVSLIDVFFDSLEDRRWLFVFDNVDQYIDLVTGQFVAGLARLYDAAHTRQHRCKFLFTCRPAVKAETMRVMSIALEGLSFEESLDLFRRRGVTTNEQETLRAAFDLTRGHPMWLNMISMQVVRMQRSLSTVLEDIKRGKGELPEKTLRSIWKSLNDNQRTLLRTLAEAERPESEETLIEIISMTANRVSKAVKTLLALQLLVVKSRSGGPETLELHPLVKSFVQKEFPRQDRDRFISVIITFLDRMIGKYKAILATQPSYEILDFWTQKAELEINRQKYEQAVLTLLEVATPLRSRGHAEDLVRIGKKLFDEIAWAEACVSYRGFDELVRLVVEALVQFGQPKESEKYLAKYEDAIPGKSAQYLNLCDLRCYHHWFMDDYKTAVDWGERGEVLAQGTKVDTKYSSAHNLALSRRDAGQIDAALPYFLGPSTLEDVLNGVKLEKDRGGQYYGNIGRCLQFQGRVDDALIVFRKSAILLETQDGEMGKLNRGYIRFWLGEVLAVRGSRELAKVFLTAAYYQWQRFAPPRAKKVLAALAKIDPELSLPRGADSHEQSEAERKVRAWLKS